MIFQGPKRAGKGTALLALRGIVEAVASPSFSMLSAEFGRQPLIGKLVALITDAHLDRNDKPLETLLTIVGNDPVAVNRKNREYLCDELLSVRFTIAVNKLPALPDHSGALASRLLSLRFGCSFAGEEDETLKRRIATEVPAIAQWALQGLKRLHDQNWQFTMPESSKEVIEEFEILTSPHIHFVKECGVRGEDCVTPVVTLYEVWKRWARTQGLMTGTKNDLIQSILSVYPDTTTCDQEIGGRKRRVLKGIRVDA
jgi:putative DNA primase/helicase